MMDTRVGWWEGFTLIDRSVIQLQLKVMMEHTTIAKYLILDRDEKKQFVLRKILAKAWLIMRRQWLALM